jgi:penicillin amidase
MDFISWLLSSRRAKRITQLLEPKSDWDKESVGKMITIILLQ